MTNQVLFCARAKGSGQSKADFSSFVMRLFYDDIVLFYFPHEKKRTVSWALWIVESVSMITLMMLEITLPCAHGPSRAASSMLPL